MSLTNIAMKLLAARKPYPNRPWQRWLGLSQGGPERRLSDGDGAWLAAMAGLPLLILGALILAVNMDAMTPALGIIVPAFWCSLIATSMMVGYAAMVSLSAGYLHPEQLARVEAYLAEDPTMAGACAKWMKDDDILRTGDLCRLHLARALMDWDTARNEKIQETSAFWHSIEALRGTPAPLPASLDASERGRIETSLVKLTRPTPARRNVWHRGWGRICQWLDYGFPWVMVATPSARWRVLIAASLLFQWGVAAWLIAPIMDLDGQRSWAGMLSMSIGVLAANAFWMGMPYLRLPAPSSLRERVQEKADEFPLVAWVLAQRCPDPARASTRDLVMAIRASGLLLAHEGRLRQELMHRAYREQIDRLPTIGASRAEAVAEALEVDTPECESNKAPRRL